MPGEFVLDTVALRVMAFGHPDGLDILLAGLGTRRLQVPAEVYNEDDDLAPVSDDDPTLSELAKGLRFARRQVSTGNPRWCQRCEIWLRNAEQLPRQIERGSLVIVQLLLEELLFREMLMERYGIGRGEAACLALARRSGGSAVFVSSDAVACRAAVAAGFSFFTLEDVLRQWVARVRPRRREIDELVDGVRLAKYGVKEELLRSLQDAADGHGDES